MTIAAALRDWLILPDVLADPHQHDGPKVWTRATDLFPGAVVVPGTPLTAVWEDLVWFGMPTWDPDDLHTLWLTPLGPPIEVPDPSRLYQEVRDDPSAADRTSMSDSLRAVTSDFAECLTLLMDARRADRRLAQNLLDEMARLPGKYRRALIDTDAGRTLLRQARRPRPRF